MKILFCCLLFLLCFAASAQKLVITNTISHEHYKIGFMHHVWLTTVSNNKEFSAYIKSVHNDTLYLFGGKHLALASINSIRFTPRNAFKRYGKPILYTIGLFMSSTIAYTFQPTDIEITSAMRWKYFGEGMLVSAFFIETAAIPIWLITPKRELIRGINLSLAEESL
ncbi:MAG: hypothetical protein Q8M15_11225 [Bacteroidota bacterium]|nr:hypothetical protein [Bacteroidota bacterium]